MGASVKNQNSQKDQYLVEWLYAHSGLPWHGAQCSEHPSIREMTSREALDALRHETGIRITRQWLWEMCRRHGIPTRGKLGPKRHITAEEKARKDLERWQRWFDGIKANQAKLDTYRSHRRVLEAARRKRQQQQAVGRSPVNGFGDEME